MKYVFLISAIVTVPIALPELSANALYTPSWGWDGVAEMAVSIYTNLQPVIASFVAIMLGQDVLTWDKPVAGALVLISAYIVTVVTAKE